MKKYIIYFLAVLIFFPSLVYASQNFKVSCSANPPKEKITEYRLYSREKGGTEEVLTVIPATPQAGQIVYPIENVHGGTCFSMTAVGNNESERTEEICIPSKPINVKITIEITSGD